MSPEFRWSWRDLAFWRTVLIQAAAVVAILFAVGLLIATLQRNFGGKPPIQAVSMDKADLGEVCPGEMIPVHNRITIDEPVVVFYYLSTTAKDGLSNIIGTQTPFPGLPHPVAGTFEQRIEWHVPDIPPGRYLRVFAIRGTDGDEKPVHLQTFYTIKPEEKCNL